MNLKVISLNLWEGHLVEQAAEFLVQQAADILLLQEVYNSTDNSLAIDYRAIQLLQEKLPNKYYAFAPTCLDIIPEGKVEQGNAIFSKFPITDSGSQFFDIPYRERNPFDPAEFPTTPRNLQNATIDANGILLNVFNFQGVWDLDGDNFSPERQNMSEIILKATGGKEHVILGGDTNAKPNNEAIKMLEAQFTNVYGDDAPVTSFNMRRKDNPGYATACVDMMLVSPGIKIDAWSYPDVDVSDHLPIIVELSL